MDSDRTSHVRIDDNAHLDEGSAISPPEHRSPQAACSPLRLRKKWDGNNKVRLVLDIPAPTTSSHGEQRGETVHRDAVSIHPATMSRQPVEDGLSQILGESSTVKSLCVKYGEGDQASIREVMSLCSRLTELEELCFRNVRGRMDYSKYFQIAESTTEFPTTLKRLHVLGRGRPDPEGVCRFLVHRLARFGMVTGLQELSTTTSDCAARVLFGYLRGLTPGPPAGETCHWPALRSLTLTCWEVGPRVTNVAANRVLHQAGMAALDLPGLWELRLVSYHPKRRREIDGLFYYIVKGEGRDTAVCFVSNHIAIGQLVADTWRRIAWENRQAVLRFSSISHLMPLPVECRWAGHGRTALKGIQHPRPHWKAVGAMWDVLGASVFFAALGLFLSLLFTHTPPERADRVGKMVEWSEGEAFFLPLY